MQVQCAPDLTSRSHSGSDFSHLRLKEEANDCYHVETKVRCLCSSTMLNDNMIQVWYPHNFLSFDQGIIPFSIFYFIWKARVARQHSWTATCFFWSCPVLIFYLASCFLQCEDAKCQVWQHMTCVLIPDKPTEGASPEVPPHFYCELCRLNRADPYVLLWLVWFTLFPIFFSFKSSSWDAQP